MVTTVNHRPLSIILLATWNSSHEIWWNAHDREYSYLIVVHSQSQTSRFIISYWNKVATVVGYMCEHQPLYYS